MCCSTILRGSTPCKCTLLRSPNDQLISISHSPVYLVLLTVMGFEIFALNAQHSYQLYCQHSSQPSVTIMMNCSVFNCIYPDELALQLRRVLFKCCIVLHTNITWSVFHCVNLPCSFSLLFIFSSHHFKLKQHLNLVPSWVKPNLFHITCIFSSPPTAAALEYCFSFPIFNFRTQKDCNCLS